MTSQARLSDFWSLTRLSERDARSGRASSDTDGLSPWMVEVQNILRSGCGVSNHAYFSQERAATVRGRTVPSAGAIYPWEVLVVAGTREERGTIYLFEAESGRLRRMGRTQETLGALADTGVHMPAHDGTFALVVFLARPWLAMKKYQVRGYFYAHVDTGHAVSNVALYARALGRNPVQSVYIARAELARHLGIERLCREPIAVVSLSSQRRDDREDRESGMVGGEVEAAQLVPPEDAEVENFARVRALGGMTEPVPPCTRVEELAHVDGADGTSLAREQFLPPPEANVQALRTCLAAIWHRRSVKGFRDLPLTQKQLGDVLAGLRGGGLHHRDATVQSKLGVRVVARHIDGLEGSYAYSPFNHSLRAVGEQPDEPLFVRACMHQELAREAAALIVVHAPTREVFAQDRHGVLTEYHVRAANAGQLLYLTATHAGVGITCIGAFDTSLCRSLAGLGEDDGVLYVMALGVSNEACNKIDRDTTANAFDAYAPLPRA